MTDDPTISLEGGAPSPRQRRQRREPGAEARCPLGCSPRAVLHRSRRALRGNGARGPGTTAQRRPTALRAGPAATQRREGARRRARQGARQAGRRRPRGRPRQGAGPAARPANRRMPWPAIAVDGAALLDAIAAAVRTPRRPARCTAATATRAVDTAHAPARRRASSRRGWSSSARRTSAGRATLARLPPAHGREAA